MKTPKLLPALASVPKHLVRPQDIRGRLAVIEGGPWPVVLRHIENDWNRPVKRTTLMWAGKDWGESGNTDLAGINRRCAIVGPLVESTRRPPFYSVTLDEIVINQVKADGAVWGRVTSTTGVHHETASRDAALDMALIHCASGDDDPAAQQPAPAPPTARQMQSNFGMVNSVVALAFHPSSGPRTKARTITVSAIRSNLSEALLPSNYCVGDQQFEFTFNSGGMFSDEAEQIRFLFADLPVVAARVQRARLDTLNTAFERAGIRALEKNPRLGVAVSFADNRDPAHDPDVVLAAAKARKRLESGWLSPQRPPLAPKAAA